jgi:hypothetical protein
MNIHTYPYHPFTAFSSNLVAIFHEGYLVLSHPNDPMCVSSHASWHPGEPGERRSVGSPPWSSWESWTRNRCTRTGFFLCFFFLPIFCTILFSSASWTCDFFFHCVSKIGHGLLDGLWIESWTNENRTLQPMVQALVPGYLLTDSARSRRVLLGSKQKDWIHAHFGNKNRRD